MRPSRLPAVAVLVLAILALAACDLSPQAPATPTMVPTLTAPPAQTAPTEAPPSPSETATEHPTTAPSPTTLTATETPRPSTPTESAVTTPTTATSSTGRIVYLDPDGATVRRMNPDGSDQETLFQINKPVKGQVVALSSDPSGEHILYAVTQGPEDESPVYYLAGLGSSKKLMSFFGTPHWSPDGTRIVGESLKPDGSQGPIYVYNVPSAVGDTTEVDGLPDFYPDGTRLVYVWKDNVYSLDLLSGQSTQLTNLPSNNQNAWIVQEAHVLTSGDKIVFYGVQFQKDGQSMLGASGNSQLWWTVPVTGGDPLTWGEPNGNNVVAYARNPVENRAAYVESAHSSACISVYTVGVLDPAAGTPYHPDLPELQETGNGAAWVHGVTWSPSGSDLAFDVQPYTCPDAGGGRTTQTSHIYTWHTSAQSGATPAKPVQVAEGSFPVWVR